MFFQNEHDRMLFMSNQQYPTFHKPITMNTRVRLPEEWVGKPTVGTVVGIASLHVMFQYIVLLDTPIQSEYGEQKAVVCSGCQLKSEDGNHDWRFSTPGEQLAYCKFVNTAF